MRTDTNMTPDRGRIDMGVRANVDEVGDPQREIGECLLASGLGRNWGVDTDRCRCGRRRRRRRGSWWMNGGEARGRMQCAVRGDEDVTAEVDGDGAGSLFFGVCGRGGRRRGRGLLADEVAADDDIVLDDGLAGENNVRGA